MAVVTTCLPCTGKLSLLRLGAISLRDPDPRSRLGETTLGCGGRCARGILPAGEGVCSALPGVEGACKQLVSTLALEDCTSARNTLDEVLSTGVDQQELQLAEHKSSRVFLISGLDLLLAVALRCVWLWRCGVSGSGAAVCLALGLRRVWRCGVSGSGTAVCLALALRCVWLWRCGVSGSVTAVCLALRCVWLCYD